AKGTVLDPVNVTGLDIHLSIKGNDASDLYHLTGVALPPTPPYTIDTKLDRDGTTWVLKNLAWTMGNSDLAGELTWDVSKPIPRLEGALHAKQIDLKDRGGFAGAAQGTATTPHEERAQAADRERERRVAAPPPAAPPEHAAVAAELVIPDKQINFDKL